jgi:hypothetical protein
MPTAIQAMTLAIDKEIHALMDPWVQLPDYDVTEDQPEHVGNMELRVGWGIPEEEIERRNARRLGFTPDGYPIFADADVKTTDK